MDPDYVARETQQAILFSWAVMAAVEVCERLGARMEATTRYTAVTVTAGTKLLVLHAYGDGISTMGRDTETNRIYARTEFITDTAALAEAIGQWETESQL